MNEVFTTLIVGTILSMVAQDMKVIDFRLLEKNLTANTRSTQKLDQNGETAALIKIQTPERGFSFDGGDDTQSRSLLFLGRYDTP